MQRDYTGSTSVKKQVKREKQNYDSSTQYTQLS